MSLRLRSTSDIAGPQSALLRVTPAIFGADVQKKSAQTIGEDRLGAETANYFAASATLKLNCQTEI